VKRSKQGHHVKRCPWCKRDFARLDTHLRAEGACGAATRAALSAVKAGQPWELARRQREPSRPVLLEHEGGGRSWWTVDPDDPALGDDHRPAATLRGHGGPPHTHLHRHGHQVHRHEHDHEGDHAAETGHSARDDPEAVDWWRPEDAKPKRPPAPA
jgi:hypothetical protein